MTQRETIKIIQKYFQKFPQDKEKLKLLEKQISEDVNFFDRKNFTGHVVANALILNEDRVLTIFHNKLHMYIQPGGHVDNTDFSVINAVMREVAEETGLKNIIIDNWHKKTFIPIFIESHLIPENKNKEKEHYHHDFMYIFRTKTKDINLQLEEVSKFEWVNIKDLLKNNSDSFIGKSLNRMLEVGIL